MWPQRARNLSGELTSTESPAPIHRWTAADRAAARAAVSACGEHLVAVHDLLNLRKASLAEDGRKKRHRRFSLHLFHVFQADSRAAHHLHGKIRPADALFVVI